MAYNNTNNPIGTPAYANEGVQTGSPSVSKGYIFADLQKPDISPFITYRFPEYSLTSLLGKLERTASVPVGNDSFEWFEKGLFRQSYTVGAGSSNLTSATATVKLLSTTVKDCGLLVDDVLRFENGDYGQVTAVAANSSDVDLTVIKAGGSANFALAAGDVFAMWYNAKAEFSDSPNGRIWKEEKLTDKVTVMRRSIICSSTVAGNIQWVTAENGSRNYYYVNEMETMQEFAKDREMYVLGGNNFGTISTTAAQSGNGILPRVFSQGVVGTYASTVSETDIQEQIRLMCVNSTGKEILVLCGSQFMSQAQRAFKDYIIQGAVDFGALNDNVTAGYEVTKYHWMGKVITFMLYTPFYDPSITPTPVRGGINFDKAALFLNMGDDSRGNPLIQLRHKEDGFGQSMAFRRTVQSGITTPEGGTGVNRSNGKDGFTVDLYASIGVELHAANNHGFMYAA